MDGSQGVGDGVGARPAAATAVCIPATGTELIPHDARVILPRKASIRVFCQFSHWVVWLFAPDLLYIGPLALYALQTASPELWLLADFPCYIDWLSLTCKSQALLTGSQGGLERLVSSASA